MAASSNREGPADHSPPGHAPEAPYSLHAIHLLRTTQMQTLQLSAMADQKASILMGASFLVFSISVSRAFAGHLPVSLAILALFAFLSSLCAVVAVLPSVSSSKGPVGANRMFFGHFALRDEAELTEQIEQADTRRAEENAGCAASDRVVAEERDPGGNHLFAERGVGPFIFPDS